VKNAKNQELQTLYKKSKEKVRKINLVESEATAHYKNYVAFVQTQTSGGKLLDIGCGSGWSSFLLSQKGFEVLGCDLHDDGYEPVASESLKFQKEDIQALSFRDQTFDVVCTNECLEHVPDPEKALREMLRVLKPGGKIVIVGPNLLSLGMSVRAALIYVWRQRPLTRVLLRDEALPRHPLGNTLPEILGIFFLNLFRILKKSIRSQPHFEMRVPDLRPPFHADSDACYLLNPIDLGKFFSQEKSICSHKSGASGRAKALELLASGTWFVATKTSEEP